MRRFPRMLGSGLLVVAPVVTFAQDPTHEPAPPAQLILDFPPSG